MRIFRNVICFTGIWLYPVASALMYLISSYFFIDISLKKLLVYTLPIFVPFLITVHDVELYFSGFRDFHLFTFLNQAEIKEENTKAFLNATYPKIDPNLKRKKPEAFVLGMDKDGSYVCIPSTRDGLNAFVVGRPGSGKSVLLKGFVIASKYHKKMPDYNFFLVDIKGEMYRTFLNLTDGRYEASCSDVLQVIDPGNRCSFGWDVYYLLRDASVSDTTKIKVITDIAEALVPVEGDNPFFAVAARRILRGVLLYDISKNIPFVDSVQRILRSELSALLKEIVDNAESEGNFLVVDALKSFLGKEGNEAIMDVDSTLKQYLSVFSYPDIQWFLRDNPLKTSPNALCDGTTSIDFAIEEAMLSAYQPVFRLITMQVLKHCECVFKETDERNTVIFIDEAKRVGAVDALDNAMATLRSKHTSLFLFFQDISQFVDIYGETKCDSILNLCELRIFLSGASDSKTIENLSNAVGEYKSVRSSFQRKGIFNLQSDLKYSEDSRDIITGSSLASLRDKDELIAIYFGKYFRIKKFKYFKDRYLKNFKIIFNKGE